ncbi:MAG: hypothetical protein EHM89_14200 [Acidobacteria bacterium]|nr:MAG: hypothetical protein EHM89_14200 [Acidobacteriota bacterium]
MRISTLTMGLALYCLCPSLVSAQGYYESLGVRGDSSQALSAQKPLSLSSSISDDPALNSWRPDDSKRTYWLEGGAIGLVVLGVVSYVGYNAVASSLCSDTGGAGCYDYRVVVTVGGAAVGFLVGALIGKGIEKPGPAAAPPPN